MPVMYLDEYEGFSDGKIKKIDLKYDPSNLMFNTND